VHPGDLAPLLRWRIHWVSVPVVLLTYLWLNSY